MQCNECIHHKVCGKQFTRKSLEPEGFELHCRFFKRESDDVKEFAKFLIDKGVKGVIYTFDLVDYIHEFKKG